MAGINNTITPQKGIISLGYNPGGVPKPSPMNFSGKLDVPAPQMGAPVAPKTSTSPFSGGLSGIYNMPKSSAPAGPNPAFGASGLGGLPNLGLTGTTPTYGNTSTAWSGGGSTAAKTATNTGGGDGSVGSYKGTPINPGDQASIQAQMAAIDAKSNPVITPAVDKLNTGDAGANTYSGGVNANGQKLAGYVPPPTQFQNTTTALGNTSSQPTPQYVAAQDQYNKANEQLQALKSRAASNPLTDLGSNQSDYVGIQGLMASNVANQESALANEMTAAQSGAQVATGQQSTQQTGLIGLGGLTKPQVGTAYGTQTVDPATGLPIGQGAGAGGTSMSQLPPQAQSFIQQLAQQVKNGQMVRGDAEAELSTYGIVGKQALQEALGPDFNTNASNASAGTTAVGQQIQTAATATNSALDTLGSLFANLNPAQTAGIPATNSIANWIATQFGDQALSSYKTNLADARSQLIGVLNSAGGTPTGNEATANQYLPENMTKQQFDANVGTTQNPGIVRQLIAQKVASFTGSGSQNPSTTNSGSTGQVINTPYGAINPSL